MYAIFKTTNLRKNFLTSVESIAAAEAELIARFGYEAMVLFERDPDHDAADACLLIGGELEIFSVEGAQ